MSQAVKANESELVRCYKEIDAGESVDNVYLTIATSNRDKEKARRLNLAKDNKIDTLLARVFVKPGLNDLKGVDKKICNGYAVAFYYDTNAKLAQVKLWQTSDKRKFNTVKERRAFLIKEQERKEQEIKEQEQAKKEQK